MGAGVRRRSPACYVVAFFAVVAEWFWGRWFATGLGWSGMMVAIVRGVPDRAGIPALAIYGLLHARVVLPLAGKSMAARYDLQEGWRQRYKMDDLGVARLRKTITRSAASLPSVILWALAPKDPGQGMLLSLVALALVADRPFGAGPAADLGLAGGRRVGGGHAAGRAACCHPATLHACGFPARRRAGPGVCLLVAAAVPFVLPALRFVQARA